MSSLTTPDTGAKLHLTRRGKLAVLSLVVLIFVVGLTIAWLQPAAPHAVATDDQQPETYQQIVVQPGDTLWGIAGRISQQSSLNQNLDRIVAYNGLESSDLEVGQTLYIPVTD